MQNADGSWHYILCNCTEVVVLADFMVLVTSFQDELKIPAIWEFSNTQLAIICSSLRLCGRCWKDASGGVPDGDAESCAKNTSVRRCFSVQFQCRSTISCQEFIMKTSHKFKWTNSRSTIDVQMLQTCLFRFGKISPFCCLAILFPTGSSTWPSNSFRNNSVIILISCEIFMIKLTWP